MARWVGAILKWTEPNAHIWLDFFSGSQAWWWAAGHKVFQTLATPEANTLSKDTNVKLLRMLSYFATLHICIPNCHRNSENNHHLQIFLSQYMGCTEISMCHRREMETFTLPEAKYNANGNT